MKAADDEAFRAFFRAEFGHVVRRLTIVTGSRETAEDSAQEAFVKLYARWRKVSGYENPQAWVRTVATRIALRAVGRKSGSLVESVPAGTSEERLDLRSAITQLTPRQRAAVILHYFDDLPIDQIADAIGCSASTVKVHLHRARIALATALHEEAPDVLG